MAHPGMGNPTLLVVTDRNDLDNQLFGVFAGASEMLRETPVQADTRPELRRLLANRPSGGIVFTTIQKFTPGEDEDSFPVLSDRRNIVVICDEAHRSQYGFEARLPELQEAHERQSRAANDSQAVPVAPAPSRPMPLRAPATVRYGYAQHLRDALPGATFVAFTGTPVSLDDRDTRAVFGDYVHIYDIEQAVKDGATVPIYYESRLAKLELKEADVTLLDSEVDELTEDEEGDAAKVAKLRRWAALEQLVGAPPRIQKVAADIVEHFENRLAAMDGKAMVVAMSREICVHLYDAIVALRPEWHSDDPAQGAIKVVMTGSASDKALLKPAHLPQGRAQAPGDTLQEPGRPVQAGHRARHVADRLRRALPAHDVRGQADARPQPDAGHRAREPRLQGQARRPGGGLHRHRQRAEGRAGRLHPGPRARQAHHRRARGAGRAGRSRWTCCTTCCTAWPTASSAPGPGSCCRPWPTMCLASTTARSASPTRCWRRARPLRCAARWTRRWPTATSWPSCRR